MNGKRMDKEWNCPLRTRISLRIRVELIWTVLSNCWLPIISLTVLLYYNMENRVQLLV